MSSNPYQSPATDLSTPDTTPAGAYRSAAGIVLCLTIFLLVGMGFDVLLGLMSLAEATLLTGAGALDVADGGGMLAFDLAYGCIALTVLPLYFTTVVLFCIWIYRANANARSLGAERMRFTPGWSVGWFFVPIMNLFRPYQAVREIYQASEPRGIPSNWKLAPVSSLLGWWWGFWIVSNMVGQAEFRMAIRGDHLASSWLGVVSGVVSVPTALLAIFVVRTIQQRQEQKAGQQVSSQHNKPFAYSSSTHPGPSTIPPSQ